MSEVNDRLQGIKKVQETIDTLLADNRVVIDGGKAIVSWSIEEIHSDDECNFGFAYSDVDGRFIFPDHIHEGSVEYLICVKGKVRITIGDKLVRILHVGECASIPPNVSHFTEPLEPASKLVYVCVPADKAFPGRRTK